MTDLDLFRVYEPHECGSDGYPRVWHTLPCNCCGPSLPPAARHSGTHAPECDSRGGVKDLVRIAAGNRCERCGHPYVKRESAVWAEEPRPEWAAGKRILDQGSLFDGHEDLAAEAGWERGAEVPDPIRTLYSPCDERCTHGGPYRWREHGGEWVAVRREQEAPAGNLVDHAGVEVQAAWRILTVHHLLSEPDQKRDLRWWNLASLCQRCHLVIQNKVKMERVFPHEHSAWFKPHAAGWYAWAYEGRSITREEALERIDELLALERVS